ncbi:glycosyltransferase family 39 protein [Anabaena sp. FACHB-1237]|uniref:ArnT family glycosyltransferase n=1 Tax=Anabaena sp. FACHB-1237 TaxID=2692769 RepID=UPI0016819D9E|nr:glycosyltransferase family 39 protein [Anabaena sp. FACHB-1237]MBD2139661.1 glycosyltransferase family 39 protein [Anabaena sp. FACHB-1237]
MRLNLSFPPVIEEWFNSLEKRPALAVTVSSLWILILWFIAFLWKLGTVGLVDETEPLFAEASRQMLVTGDWITPFFNGVTRFDKPALIYWCQAISYAIIGVNEWAARLPSALAALAVMALGFYTVKWHLTQKNQLQQISNPSQTYIIAGIASALIGVNPEMIIWGRTGVSDMLLTGCIASALLCFFLGYAQNLPSINIGKIRLPNQWYLACYVLIAGAILTKGPVGIVLPGLIMISFAIYLGKFWELWREMQPILGIGIILILSMPWYILVTLRNGWNFINAFFGYHNIERFTEVVNGHSAPWYFYLLIILLLFAPYSIYIPGALANIKFWQRSQFLTQERSQHLGLFAAFWFLGVFIFFTIAVTKLPSYVLPLMPAAGILVGLFYSDLYGENSPINPQKSLKISSWINVGFVTIISVALFNLTKITGQDPAAPELYQSLQNSGLLTYGGIVWLLTAIIIAVLILTYHWRYILIINLIGFMAFLGMVLMPAMSLMDAQRQLPLRELATTIVQEKQPQEELVMVGFKKPTVTFYTRTNVNYISSSQEFLEYVKKQSSPQKLTEKPPSSLLLLAEQKKFMEMNLSPDDYKNIATKGAYHLIRVPLKVVKKPKSDISDSSQELELPAIF